MEHQTLVMLNRGYIGGGHDGTISHELSHMWWGDMVTHVGYADVWLNEGFATWAECMYMGHANGRNYFNTYIRGKAGSYISGDRGRRFPIYNPPWALIYDYGTIYCKGAWVVHMLRWAMGDTTWEQPGVLFRTLRAYGDSFRYGTASTEDFKRICEQQSGLELDWFFDEWVYQAGYPKYHLNWSAEPSGEGFRLITSLAQANGAQAPDYFQTPLPVRVAFASRDTMVTIRPGANPQIDTFAVSAEPVNLVVDPDNWVLDSNYVTGIAEPADVSSIGLRHLSVSPNPARNRVSVNLSSPLPLDPCPAILSVYDAAGRSVLTRTLDPSVSRSLSLDLSYLPSGVYYLQLSGRVSTPPTRLVIAR
jgi:aminopeptidase N